MTLGTFGLAILVSLLPYAAMLNFRAPFELKLKAKKQSGLVKKICVQWLRTIVLVSGALLGIAVVLSRSGLGQAALLVFICDIPLLALLIIPGLVAFREEYHLN